MQKSRKITSRTSSTSTRPEKLAERPGREPQMLRHDLVATLRCGSLGVAQCSHRFLQMLALPLARDQGRLRREKLRTEAHRGHELVDTHPGCTGHRVHALAWLRSQWRPFSCGARSILLTIRHTAVSVADSTPSRKEQGSRKSGAVASTTQSRRLAAAACSAARRTPSRSTDRQSPGCPRCRHRDGKAAEIEMELQHVTRRSRKRRHNGRFAPREPIEQGRLSRIGRTCNGDAEPFAQPLARSGAGATDLVGQRTYEIERLHHGRFRNVFFVGEVDGCFDRALALRSSVGATFPPGRRAGP